MQYDSDTDPYDRELAMKMSTEAYEAACFIIEANDLQFGNFKKGQNIAKH